MPHADSALVPERCTLNHCSFTLLANIPQHSDENRVLGARPVAAGRPLRRAAVLGLYLPPDISDTAITSLLQVSNLANASSVIYNSLLAFPKFFGRTDDKAVNWAGASYSHSHPSESPETPRLIRGHTLQAFTCTPRSSLRRYTQL
jgi:hypothetical protein